MDIPFYYDPMIAKLICCAENREEAIHKMIRAIDEYEITGLQTTLGFCDFVMKHEAFRSANFDTNFVETHFKPALLERASDENEALIAAMLSVLAKDQSKSTTVSQSQYQQQSQWKKNRLAE
jgi:propionyl-CoA carboxylase alpha chain